MCKYVDVDLRIRIVYFPAKNSYWTVKSRVLMNPFAPTGKDTPRTRAFEVCVV